MNDDERYNLELRKQVQKLHRLSVWGRWIFVVCCWTSFGLYGIWELRREISLWLEHFTWAALRYGLYYNGAATLCLAWCIGITASVLVWQTRNIFRGISKEERQRLEQRVKTIRAFGPAHPLWKWICN